MVDDDASFRRDLCECIESSGFTAVAASGSADAIRWLRFTGLRPRVIFLDLNLLEGDTFEFRTWLRNERTLRSIPVVLVSGHPDVRHYVEQLEAVQALEKPVAPERVIDCLQSLAS